jgi:hypothetical protein
MGPTMNKMLLATCFALIPLAAFGQSPSEREDRGDRRDAFERSLREFAFADERHAPRRGFGFLLRSGDATVAVRCDPTDSMKACVDATTTFVEKVRPALQAGGAPPAPGAAPSR